MAGRTLPKPGDENVLYVLDVSGYVHRAYHALPALSSSKGEPTHAVLGFTNMLLKFVADQKPQLFCCALDPGGPSFRKEVYPQYKENRRSAPPDIFQQIARCYEIVRAYEIPLFQVEKMEADDLIATVVRRATEEKLRTVIVSSDKDLLQLVNNEVSMYDTMRNKVYGPEETLDKMLVPPSQVRDLLALTGDSSDNIPGVPSVGPKTAKKLLEEYGDLDGIYDHVDDITKKALKAKLIEHRDNAFLSRDLVSLKDDVAIEFGRDALHWTGGDTEKLRELFTDLEFHRPLELLDPEPVYEERARLPRDVLTDEAALAAAATAIRALGEVALTLAIEDDAPLTGELVGIGLATAEHVYYVPLAHRYLGAPDQLDVATVVGTLGPVLEDAAVQKWAVDIKRALIALRKIGITLRGATFDTTIASYLLEAGRHAHTLADVSRAELAREVLTYAKATGKQKKGKLALSQIEVERGVEYAGDRAEVVHTLHERLAPRIEKQGFLDLLNDVELPLATVLARLEMTGVRIDVPFLNGMSTEVGTEIRRLDERCQELAGKEFNVGSPRQLEAILFDELGLPVIKKTKTARSTDADVLEELAEQHELPKVILEHRTLSKLRSTYLEALPKQVNAETGRVHTVYNQAVAATGRLSSSDPNLQNIPIRTEIGRRIRNAFIPGDGMEIFSADYSQIELRVLAHLSNDEELIDAFQKHEDVHVRTATALFECGAGEVTREQRGQAKTVNYAVIYGQSQFALARNLKITKTEAKRYIDAFFERYAGVREYMDGIIDGARKAGSVRTILDRRRELPDLRSRNFRLRSAAERIARNTPIQGSAADIMKVAMIRIDQAIDEAKLNARMLLTVHDELVFEAPPEEKKPLEALVRDHMEHAVELKVPMVVDGGWGKHWGEAH
ncbi:MAG: DNA polymerase I [Myxococcota bacterium]